MTQATRANQRSPGAVIAGGNHVANHGLSGLPLQAEKPWKMAWNRFLWHH
jgi:hypothetical protein